MSGSQKSIYEAFPGYLPSVPWKIFTSRCSMDGLVRFSMFWSWGNFPIRGLWNGGCGPSTGASFFFLDLQPGHFASCVVDLVYLLGRPDRDGRKEGRFMYYHRLEEGR
jgi:hypothetical protein